MFHARVYVLCAFNLGRCSSFRRSEGKQFMPGEMGKVSYQAVRRYRLVSPLSRYDKCHNPVPLTTAAVLP